MVAGEVLTQLYAQLEVHLAPLLIGFGVTATYILMSTSSFLFLILQWELACLVVLINQTKKGGVTQIYSFLLLCTKTMKISIFLLLSLFILSCTTRQDEFSMPDSYDLPFIIDCWRLMGIEADDSNWYLIDTGFTHSVLFRDRIDIPFQTRGVRRVNRSRIVLWGRVDSINMGGLIVKNHNFAFMSSRNTVFAQKMPNVIGVIGMDILSQRHSFFDIENQRLYLSTSPHGTLYPCFTLSYTMERRNRPFVSLTINDTEFNNILFDSGYNQFLRLNETEIGLIKSIASTSKIGKSNSESTDALNNTRMFPTITVDSLDINGFDFTGRLPIQFTNSTQLLGSAFILAWRAFSINPETKTINFYRYPPC